MCGIAGVLSLKGKKRIPYNLIEKMIGSIQHRGPDESGIYIDDRIGPWKRGTCLISKK
jgi:asparagine synthase (glutamine-hydrolysing)